MGATGIKEPFCFVTFSMTSIFAGVFLCPNLGTYDCFENVSSLAISRVQVDGPINFEGFLSVTEKEIPHQLS